MKIKLVELKDKKMNNNMISIEIKHNLSNEELEKFREYIKLYPERNSKIIGYKENKIIGINYSDVVMFYSKKTDNYCMTKSNNYLIKNKLYELEHAFDNFIRISKKCIINLNYVEYFDRSYDGKIFVKLSNGLEEKISRRRIKYVLDYLKSKGL